ncbi:MAG: hypothetical protein LBQ13_00360 [Endomicrobium sp.]|jgi:superoxide reductase|nr:hypothetical protein [Endomicrobium sp.]
MKGLVCKVCGYVALDGKKDWCPVCHLENVFEEKEDAYKLPDFKVVFGTGETEKKHVPMFTIVQECGLFQDTGCIDVHVKVGEIAHPTLSEHHITEIVFYIDNKFVSKIILTANINPSAVIHLNSKTKGKVQVIGNCNIHGRWFNEVEIK